MQLDIGAMSHLLLSLLTFLCRFVRLDRGKMLRISRIKELIQSVRRA